MYKEKDLIKNSHEAGATEMGKIAFEGAAAEPSWESQFLLGNKELQTENYLLHETSMELEFWNILK